MCRPGDLRIEHRHLAVDRAARPQPAAPGSGTPAARARRCGRGARSSASCRAAAPRESADRCHRAASCTAPPPRRNKRHVPARNKATPGRGLAVTPLRGGNPRCPRFHPATPRLMHRGALCRSGSLRSGPFQRVCSPPGSWWADSPSRPWDGDGGVAHPADGRGARGRPAAVSCPSPHPQSRPPGGAILGSQGDRSPIAVDGPGAPAQAPRLRKRCGMANPFVHVELHTDDVAKAKAFYSRLFGWKLEDHADAAAAARTP